ncbi:hypothetical protein BpHYR1_044105 [Brachionus plicatilis]|uniref:Uncharacterized protein n=1 Tax=Brachionus plicatilis TaxID=10195 RepID=A0A3M7Q900_BRAPC|nr:hypothetical protein BpHYR1_044105 [Brachionus plicatilis]
MKKNLAFLNFKKNCSSKLSIIRDFLNDLKILFLLNNKSGMEFRERRTNVPCPSDIDSIINAETVCNKLNKLNKNKAVDPDKKKNFNYVTCKG